MNKEKKKPIGPTPGPWRALLSPHAIAIQHDGTPDIVGWQGFDDSDRLWGEHAANARLIAASPVMYEALVRLGKTLRGPIDDRGPDPEELEEYYAAMDAVKALAAELAEAVPSPSGKVGGE